MTTKKGKRAPQVPLAAKHGADPLQSLRRESLALEERPDLGAGNSIKRPCGCSRKPKGHASPQGLQREIPDAETADWRAVCGKTARTVRREGRPKPSLPLSEVFVRGDSIQRGYALARKSQP